ncbi:exodeoxyribonuclease VII large subunit, partial [Halomonas sp. 707D4]|uniref:exodeoxyribonuclease VII large subunit n=1 Tax=Halomonas sp. 707D4 TaxID=1904455 RepID=UPI00209F0A0F
MPDAAQALSVSDLNKHARQALERDLGEVWVEGELSNVSKPASGHIYFTLKDDRAQVRCALFRQRARFVAAPLRDGDQVKLRGRVSLFEPRGDYQLIAKALAEAGADGVK